MVWHQKCISILVLAAYLLTGSVAGMGRMVFCFDANGVCIEHEDARCCDLKEHSEPDADSTIASRIATGSDECASCTDFGIDEAGPVTVSASSPGKPIVVPAFDLSVNVFSSNNICLPPRSLLRSATPQLAELRSATSRLETVIILC